MKPLAPAFLQLLELHKPGIDTVSASDVDIGPSGEPNVLNGEELRTWLIRARSSL